MPKIRRMAHVCLGTPDLVRLIGFYSEFLDAKVIHEFRNISNERYGVLMALAPGTFLELFHEPDPQVKFGQGLFRHLCLQVDDIEQMASHARTLGLTVEIKRGRTDRTLQFTIIDPDGTPIEFHQYDPDCVQYPYLSDS